MASKQVIINLSTTNSFQKIKLDLDFPYIEKALLNSLKTIRREKKKKGFQRWTWKGNPINDSANNS